MRAGDARRVELEENVARGLCCFLALHRQLAARLGTERDREGGRGLAVDHGGELELRLSDEILLRQIQQLRIPFLVRVIHDTAKDLNLFEAVHHRDLPDKGRTTCYSIRKGIRLIVGNHFRSSNLLPLILRCTLIQNKERIALACQIHFGKVTAFK